MAIRVQQKDAIRVSFGLTALDCGNCGIIFGIDSEYETRRRNDHRQFYCPNGHPMSYGEIDLEAKIRQVQADLQKAQSESKKAKDLLETERRVSQQLHDSLQEESRRHSATKGQLTRARNRAQAGVCIECHRHFANVESHMRSQHGTKETARAEAKAHGAQA